MSSGVHGKIELSASDLQSFVSFGNWMIKNFTNDKILLKDLDKRHIEFALKEIMHSKEVSNLDNESRSLFISAINNIIPNIDKIMSLEQKDE